MGQNIRLQTIKNAVLWNPTDSWIKSTRNQKNKRCSTLGTLASGYGVLRADERISGKLPTAEVPFIQVEFPWATVTPITDQPHYLPLSGRCSYCSSSPSEISGRNPGRQEQLCPKTMTWPCLVVLGRVTGPCLQYCSFEPHTSINLHPFDNSPRHGCHYYPTTV